MASMKILGVILLLCAASLLILGAYTLYDSYANFDDIEIVDCYDKNGNKIIGVECESNNTDNIKLGLFCMVFGSIAMAVGSFIWSRDD